MMSTTKPPKMKKKKKKRRTKQQQQKQMPPLVMLLLDEQPWAVGASVLALSVHFCTVLASQRSLLTSFKTIIIFNDEGSICLRQSVIICFAWLCSQMQLVGDTCAVLRHLEALTRLATCPWVSAKVWATISSSVDSLLSETSERSSHEFWKFQQQPFLQRWEYSPVHFGSSQFHFQN